jgi:hypothetical protein
MLREIEWKQNVWFSLTKFQHKRKPVLLCFARGARGNNQKANNNSTGYG